MLTLKKIWLWIKAYWYIPAIIFAIGISIIFLRKSPKSLIDILSKRREIYGKEVEAINKIHKEEIEDRDKAIKTYHKTIKAIEEKHSKDTKVLDEKKKKEILKIVKETHNNPDLLSKKLADQMGFEVVHPKE
jgi:hypothetical protein